MPLKPPALFLLLLVASPIFAQGQTEVTSVYTAQFFTPALVFEQRISKRQTIVVRPGIALSLDGAAFNDIGKKLYADLSINFQYRYYYNLPQRAAKGKRTDTNSGNYMAVFYKAIFSTYPFSSDYYVEEKKRAVNKLGLIWGMQRNFVKRFSVNLHAGLAYYFTKGTAQDIITANKFTTRINAIVPLADVQLGFWLNRKNNR